MLYSVKHQRKKKDLTENRSRSIENMRKNISKLTNLYIDKT